MNIITPDQIDFSAYLEETEARAKVRPADVYLDEMVQRIGAPDEQEAGAYLPWRKTHNLIRLRPGEVTLWAGINGHGKSLVTGLVGTSLVLQGERVCIASFEMKPRKTLHRMARQFTGFDDTGDLGRDPRAREALADLYDQLKGVCRDRLWIYDQQGSVKTETMIGVARYCAKELGIKHLFIDSLMKCIKGEDDFNGQKYFVDELTAIARDYDCHIHLVHHLRKLGKETEQPDKADVKGSGAVTDQVDNLMLVWRNKQKELDREAGKQVLPDDPDTVVFCRKQRNGTGWEGPIRLWFEPESMRFVSHHGATLDMAAWPHD